MSPVCQSENYTDLGRKLCEPLCYLLFSLKFLFRAPGDNLVSTPSRQHWECIRCYKKDGTPGSSQSTATILQSKIVCTAVPLPFAIVASNGTKGNEHHLVVIGAKMVRLIFGIKSYHHVRDEAWRISGRCVLDGIVM